MPVLGVISIIVAIIAFVMHLRTSYITQGGRLGQDPCVAAAAIQVPMMTMLGLAILNRATGQLDFLWWQWALLWFVETLIVVTMTVWIGNFAYRRARRLSK